jgi:hypothetical protein
MSKKQAVEKDLAKTQVVISAPKLKTAEFTIRGTAPYLQQAFSQKAREEMKAKQEAGSQSKKGKNRQAKDFQQCYEQSKHISRDGWCGIPAGAFRAGMVSACRLVGYKMTLAKLSLFVEADGFDQLDGTPLIKIRKGEPEYVEHMVRIQNTSDIRARAMWKEGWEAKVRIKFDEDQFSLKDISNLMLRLGMQVGLGEGRPDSRSSVGMGWGTFELMEKAGK